jgi:hypothetical protein
VLYHGSGQGSLIQLFVAKVPLKAGMDKIEKTQPLGFALLSGAEFFFRSIQISYRSGLNFSVVVENG